MSNEVRFGKNIVISTKSRLKRFDNGTAQAYQASDKSKKYVAIVSGIESFCRWTAVNTYDSLTDTSFMRMVGNGIVTWTDGTQKYVFLYDSGLGECLVPEGATSDVQWRHPEIVEYLIQPVARVLRDMQDKTFHHGSIRPSNIFHSASDKKGQVILGDCLSVHSCSSQPEVFMPIEKSCCHPMARGNGSISDDIYAFGVSLAMFLRKGDETSRMSEEDLLRSKIENGSYNTIIGKERLPSIFIEVLRGVLHDNPKLRWGVDEIFMWLDGTRMNPPPQSRRKKANRPLIFNGQKYLYADSLALDLNDNMTDLAGMIEDESLHQWIEKSLAEPLVLERYEKATERISALGGASVNLDFSAAQVRFALNPALPVRYRQKVFCYDGAGGMIADACYQKKDMSFFDDILNLNLLDHAVASKGLHQTDVVNRLRLFDRCRTALRTKGKIGQGIEKCVYMLAPTAPCMSPMFKGFFVNGHTSALNVYEKLSKKGGQPALFMDHHAIAFFSAHNPNETDRVIYDIDSDSKDKKVIGNLKYLATMQMKAKKAPVPAVAKVFLDAMSGVYSKFKNKKLQEKTKKNVEAAAAAGDLISMLSYIEDIALLKKDKNAFMVARREYAALQNEYNEYNRRMANKSTYGVTNGRDVAAVVAWLISTIVSVFVVFAFLSGYRIF